MITNRLRRIGTRASLALAAFAMSLQGAPIVFNATGTNSASGNALSASASFDIVGTTLTLVLTNNNAVSVPSDVLIALFWDMGTNTTVLTGFDADVSAGSTPSGQDLDATGGNGEWKYAANAAGLAGVTQHYGVGTAGLGIFPGGGGQQFNWGLINGKSNANPAVSGGTFIDNSATFTFTIPSNFTGTISNVRFQFGTALNEPSIICSTPECTPNDDTPTPEPATFGAMGVAVVGLAAMLRKRG
ncbi:MAG: hypothetical protein U0R19_14680 [Bryobacteraceae bacterium]